MKEFKINDNYTGKRLIPIVSRFGHIVAKGEF